MSKLLSELPVGAKVKAVGSKFYGKDLIFRVLGPGHSQDPADSVILQTNDIISVRCFDAKEPNSPDSIRQGYGNNRYLYSNLLQWLNSDAGAGEWYSAKHGADQKPDSANVWQYQNVAVNPYDTQAGFMNGFTTDFKNSLLTVTKRTAKSSVDGGGFEDVQSKFFLLSTTEVGLANENSIAEGSMYSLFSDSSKRVMVLTTECANNSVGYTITAGSARHWWLRTPVSSNSYLVRIVYANGSLSNDGALAGSIGLAPACAISKNQKVSDTVDEDGAYRLIYTQQIPIPTVSPTSYTYTGSEITPTITGYDSEKMTIGGQYVGINAGSYSATFTLNDGYIWSDNTTEAKTVIWNIDKAELEQPTVTGSFTYDEEAHSPTIIGFDSSHMVQSGDTSGINAGDYTLTISLSDSANYKFEDTDSTSLNFDWSIAKDIVASPTLSGLYTYDGTEQEVTINGFDSTKMNKSGGLATNAGQYTVVISLIDSNNYSFSDESSTLSLTWTIEKANGFITLEKNSVSINATEFDTVDVVDSSGNVTVSSIDESIATSEIESNVITITGVDVGETSVTVSASESLNYLATSDTIDVTVNQAPIPPGPEPPTPSKNYKRYYARHKKSDGSYELKSYWTSSQTVEFEDGQTLEAYKIELSSDINDKGDNIDYSLDDGKIYLYSGDTEIAAEDMRIRVQPNIVLDDISNLSIRVSNGRVRFTWQDPSDVIFSELPLVEWAGTKVVRKIGSAPNDASDGTLVLDSKVRDQYASTPYFDSNLSSETYYYYRFFPYDKNGNYYGKTCAVIYVPAQLVAVDIPYVENTYAYTGSNITPSFVNFDSTKMTKSGATSAKNVGDYTITFTLRDGFKWSDNTTSPKDVTWSIDRAAISTLPSAEPLTYNGSEQSPTWTNYDNAKLEISGVTTGTNAGEYSAIFTPTDNYKWSDNTTSSKNIIWTISKANGYVSLSTDEISIENGDSDTITVSNETGSLSVSVGDSNIIEALISNNIITINAMAVGITSIVVNVAESTNYYATAKTVSVEVLRNKTKVWVNKTWNGYVPSNWNTEYYVWTDGDDVYYSNNSQQYVLNKATSTWETKTWGGLTSFVASNVWTDGDNIYYSNKTNHYVLNKQTYTWSGMTWSGISNFYGGNIWTDGDNTYYSADASQYVLNKGTNSWSRKTWNGSLLSFRPSYIWTDGDDIYFSSAGGQYVLDKSTSTWNTKTWYGLTQPQPDSIWTDGENIYYSTNSINYYVLNKETSTWIQKAWDSTPYPANGFGVWLDENHVYYSYQTTHLEFITQ